MTHYTLKVTSVTLSPLTSNTQEFSFHTFADAEFKMFKIAKKFKELDTTDIDFEAKLKRQMKSYPKYHKLPRLYVHSKNGLIRLIFDVEYTTTAFSEQEPVQMEMKLKEENNE